MPGVDQLRRKGHLAPDLPMRKQKLRCQVMAAQLF